MFRDAKAFDADISAWDVSSVGQFTHMFSGASSLGACRKHNIQASFSANNNWAAAGYPWTDEVCPPITDANKADAVSQWVDDEAAGQAAFGHVSTWNVSLVTSMYEMFSGKATFDADLDAWDTASVHS